MCAALPINKPAKVSKSKNPKARAPNNLSLDFNYDRDILASRPKNRKICVGFRGRNWKRRSKCAEKKLRRKDVKLSWRMTSVTLDSGMETTKMKSRVFSGGEIKKNFPRPRKENCGARV